SSVAESLARNRRELIHEIRPRRKTRGVPERSDRTHIAISPSDRTKLTRAATAFGMTIVEVEFSSESELDSAVAKLIGQRVDVIYAGATIAANMRGRLSELANRSRLPGVGG